MVFGFGSYHCDGDETLTHEPWICAPGPSFTPNVDQCLVILINTDRVRVYTYVYITRANAMYL